MAPLDSRIAVQEGVMMHDMAITEDYAILLDVPLVFRPEVRSPQWNRPAGPVSVQ